MAGFLTSVSAFFARFPEKLQNLTQVAAKLSGVPGLDLIPGLAKSLEDGSFAKALPGLVASKYLPIKLLESGFDPKELLGESGPLKQLLTKLSAKTMPDAIQEFLKLPDCGSNALGEPDTTALSRPLDVNGDQPIVWACLTSDGLLPSVRVKDELGSFSPAEVTSAFLDALNQWKGKDRLKIAFAPGTVAEANLLVSGRTGGFGANVVAVGDIGPLHQKKCRLIFNLAEEYSVIQFNYTVAHEFGHCLGVSHADVSRTGALMSPVMDEARGYAPGAEDIDAAVKCGWKKA